MEDVTDITPQLEQLQTDVEKLKENLKPLMNDGLADLSSKLPLLEKAKLNVLAVYTIESLLFSALRLNGVEVKTHPVFTELARVRQYFEKIQKLEAPPEKRETTVNTEAAARIVRADLGSNSKDLKDKLTELIARERAKATEKKRPAEESTPEAQLAASANGKKNTKRAKHGTPSK